MFDNVLHQSATDLLTDDITRNTLPGSILLSGPASSGKLTCALELARVLACTGETKGAWSCTCPSCLKHKALVSPSVLLTGPSDCLLEIRAARDTFQSQYANSGKHLEASRYLFVRAVRKLTMRFDPILWQNDDKQSKWAPLLQNISEALEPLEPGRPLPEEDELEKLISTIEDNCVKLDDKFLYNALPVSQIRACSAWAHLSATNGKKVLIIENADRMAESARNALLKILEEPPRDCQFILTTSNRSAMLATILSRVRTYQFFERDVAAQQEVITRVFHFRPFAGETTPDSIELFLQGYLPVKPELVLSQAKTYFSTIAQGHVPDVNAICASCNGFEPRALFSVFIKGITDAQKKLSATARGTEASGRIMDVLRHTYNNVTVYNQTTVSALEEMARSLMQINFETGGVLKEAL
ncbi:MAG: DNA polymerase III [Treponema sp.]|nr:DNA polymerase III [Treponema sp.]